MDKDPFQEYLRESEPNKSQKGYVWSTAIGLQAVDGLMGFRRRNRYLWKRLRTSRYAGIRFFSGKSLSLSGTCNG